MGFAWGGQQNGRIDSSLMVDTGGGQYLRADAAAGLALLKGAFRATFGKDLTTSECYRPYQRQVDLYNLYRLGQGYVASVPGGSIHGWGLATDINSWCYGGQAGTPEHNWLIDAGRAYGWDWLGTGKPSGEPWHFDFTLTPTTTTAASTTTPLEEDDMTPEQAKDFDILVWQVNQMKGQLNDLTTGKGEVHRKLDLNVWALTDPKAGVRALLGKIIAKLGA
jgi:hypothetical protein